MMPAVRRAPTPAATRRPDRWSAVLKGNRGLGARVGRDAVQVAARAGGRRCPDADRGGRGHVRGTGLAVTFFETEDDLRIEVDLFEDALAGLVIAEVEFPSSAAADAFEPPDWFGEEVTGRAEWGNPSLATRGRPDAG